MSASNIQVAIKVRPILRKEKEQKQTSNWKVAGNSIQLIEGQPDPFYFDHIFDQDVCNQIIFDTMAKQIVDSGLKGFNGTIFAYGQTASGKTYTMMGDEQNPGVMVLATKEIFKEIEKAADRQFLLRVGYIEIYNEKIFDLLNKSNQDLKIHETPNGDVSVNCSEHIITCEQDLLSCLGLGNKQRKIGETNMNERSSRSHAIFRIIIESRKRDKTDEDSVQISILNLVDLAGSERADQTGATGSRLKEGGHINKSLLFLSCVIKQLAEDKYVNYRDSKLTRILQASLGGNALTAIICTVNPTAVEETWSTLSFANRAKVVKNKPQVNEVLTDAAMMKRLEKEIYRLQNELKVEKTKNSQIKVDQLQRRLIEENHKIINSNSSYSLKEASEKRRRTWCPSSLTPPVIEESSSKTETCLPQPTMAAKMPTKLLLPKSGMNFTPHITLRDVYYQHQLKEIECSPSIDEEFIPAEDVCFDEVLTPQASPSHLRTPTKAVQLRTASLTPRLTEKESLQKVERELKELEAFTNLENKLNVEHDTYNTLKYKLENAERVIARYEKEREDFAFIKVDHREAEINLSDCQKRCEELVSKNLELEKASLASSEQVVRYEKEVNDLKAKITQLEMENREAVSLDFEYQQHKIKSKRREAELLEALEEKQKEINKLERALQTLTTEAQNNSKEELKQLSRTLDESESVCVKCKDLQQILAENNQLTQNFEKINLDCQALQLSLEKITSEAESAKLKADSLETENDSLKKDAEDLKSLHGTLEEVQNQITSLQEEKRNLESVKTEFEVMSKETANKIAEKISISQEIQTLSIQRDSLSAECDKLSADIGSNGQLSEELNKLRTENDSLHSELQTIKSKLETVQLDYNNLIIENQAKSDNFEKLNMEVVSARNQLQALQSEYDDIQQKYEQIQAECNKHEGTIGEIQSEYDSIQNKYQCLQREYEKLENDSVQSIADCDRVQTQNENLETEIRELKTKVEEAQRKLLENDTLQLELESLKSEMNRQQEEYDKDLARRRESLSPDVDIHEENTKLKHDLENLQQQFNEMQKEYDDTSTQLLDSFAEFETLQRDMAKLEEELKQYKDLAVATDLADDLKALKLENEQLQAVNSSLQKETAEWQKTVSTLTKSMHEKCDEREKLVAQLEEVKNESASSSTSLGNHDYFIQLAESFVEIEIPRINRTFQVVDASKSSMGNRMIIGGIGGITQGSFNELRGSIEFAISSDKRKASTEIYDSLDIEENSNSANSCDSLEPGRQSNETQINELLEEKTQLFERIRALEEAIGQLRVENDRLTSAQAQLVDTQHIVEQLNGEKLYLTSICDENKCKINELNEIISRAESDNKKLIADCEELKKTVESECAVESVSREVYVQLKGEHEEKCEELSANERKLSESVKELEELRKQVDEATISAETAPRCKCEEYQNEISKLESMVNLMTVELHKFHEKDDGVGLPVRSELEDTITELHEQLQICKCAELQAALDDNTAKYEKGISAMVEQLKQQECKCQEVQIEIIELRTSLEGKIQESVESLTKFEELSVRYTKLEAEYDELSKLLSSEQKKSIEMEDTILSLGKMEEECILLQNSMAGLNESIALLTEERNCVLKQKETLQGEYDALHERLQALESEYDSLKSIAGDQTELKEKLRELEGMNEALMNEKTEALEQMQQFEQEKKEITEECQILKNSERSLHEQLQKLVQDHELLVRDKEKLEVVHQSANEELNKVKEECKASQIENQKAAEELRDQLKEVSAENTRLQGEFEEVKGQMEKLKESEKAVWEEKLSSLTNELNELMTAKNEIQIALEKSEKHSELLLQEGKELEEELSAVRNSNNSMAQEIENFEKTKADLRAKLEKVTTEKNELADQLGSSSQLEWKLGLLEQQMLDSKRALSAAMLVKDELLAELSKKNNSLLSKSSELEEKCELLQQELAESKRCLLTEVHQKEVLEKANTERDDLIVQLTNKNNSLVTKSSELEEKLAILGNQYEESKKHFSIEAARLAQLQTEASNLNATQASKIEDLTSKIASLEVELKDAQSVAAERDTLMQNLDQMQGKYDTLAVEHANLELTRSSFEAELHSARSVVIENTKLTQRLQEMQSMLKELQLKCASLSSANEELQSTNQSLVKQLEDTGQQAGECKRLNNEIVQLRQILDETQTKAKAEQQTNAAASKERSFVETIARIQSDSATLVSEKKAIQEQLANTERVSVGKIEALEQQIKLLQKDENTSLSKSISPKREKIDHLMGENHQLKVKNMSLMDKLDSCQKSQNEERRNRRLSTHDERRLLSFWDSNRDVGTMTEPTSTECSCSELDRKLNELRQKLLIRESQVNTLSMELKNHPLKTENATLKKLLIEEESKQQQLRQELKKYKQLVRTNESRSCSKCTEISKRIVVHSATQTIDGGNESECYRKLLNKYEDLKMICRVRHTKIKELEDALSTGKENANDNCSSLHNQQYRQKYEQLLKDFKILKEKYEDAKILCNNRYEQIQKLSSQQSGKTNT